MYTLGKWLSNFAVLGVIVFVLMLAAVVMQLIQREDPQIDLWALLAPFIFGALPFMALVAAITVLFETISWLRGSLGNPVYFFLFVFVILFIGVMLGQQIPFLDWLGFGLFSTSMGGAARAAYPTYKSGMTLAMLPLLANIQTFHWSGVNWTAEIVLTRMATILLSLAIVSFSAVVFDRFNPSCEMRRGKSKTETPIEPGSESSVVASPALNVRLTPLSNRRSQFRFDALLLAELRLMFMRLRWWGYLVAAGTIVAPFLAPATITPQVCLMWAWLFPVLQWSNLGCREARNETRQFLFAAPHPLANQLPAQWLSGFILALLISAGCALRLGINGDIAELQVWFVGALFIPSLALAPGVWSGNNKLFEVLYVVWWYLGPMNHVVELDFIGTTGASPSLIYLVLSVVLFASAFVGRKRQIQA